MFELPIDSIIESANTKLINGIERLTPARAMFPAPLPTKAPSIMVYIEKKHMEKSVGSMNFENFNLRFEPPVSNAFILFSAYILFPFIISYLNANFKI